MSSQLTVMRIYQEIWFLQIPNMFYLSVEIALPHAPTVAINLQMISILSISMWYDLHTSGLSVTSITTIIWHSKYRCTNLLKEFL